MPDMKDNTADGGDNWTSDVPPQENTMNSTPSGEDQINGGDGHVEHPPVPGTPAPTPKG